METKIYTTSGASTTSFTLPESVFGVAWNPDLVHEVVVAMQSNARAGTAHTKDRSEVAGGGRKPWKQKGTGRARHGSRRSPIWTGGGVTFGPRNEKDFSKKINKKVRNKAFASALSKKFAEGEVILVDTFALTEPKTAAAKAAMVALAEASTQTALKTKRTNTALVVLSDRDIAVEKSFRNFGNVKVVQVKDINLLDLLTYKYTIIAAPAETVASLERRVSASSTKA